MDQHKLYRTIKELGEAQFRTEEQLLAHVVENTIAIEDIPIRGGRIWKFEPSSGSYRLLRQFGEMEPIDRNFRIRVSEYPPFLQLAKRGTVLGTETNRYLRQRGIRSYSAIGVGEKVQWKGTPLYPYIIAVNAEYLKQDMIYALNIIGTALTSALKNRRIESKAKQLEADIDKARDIQKSIVPAHELRFGEYDLYGISLPARVVGGDFFDYLQASDDKDRLGVVIADAASKGMSAAAQALYVAGALRMGVEHQVKISTLITRLNALVNKTFTPEHFVSMVYAELTSGGNGLVFYVNAGHSNPILIRGSSEEAQMLPATGQIIGPFPGEKYRAEFAILGRGDVLVLYTDGIVEASNDNHEMYGEQRLIRTIRQNRQRTPKEMSQLILQEVQLHDRLAEYSDDKTLVVIKRIR